MIVFHYIDIDELERVFAVTSHGNQRLVLKARHRCTLEDDMQRTFGNYLLPSCIEPIENELGVEPQMAVSPLVKQAAYLKYILDSINTFDDHRQGVENFVLSFSEDQDNSELWHRNAHGGRGVALGFDTDRLQPDFNRFMNVYSKKCTYWPDDIKSLSFHLAQDNELYASIREMYKMMSDPRVVESFKTIYSQDGSATHVPQRLKDTLVSNIVTSFDLFHKQDVWRNEKEYRISLSTTSFDVQFEKDESGDFAPYADVAFPVDALRMIVIGPKSGRNAYGMVRSLLTRKGVSQNVKLLESRL